MTQVPHSDQDENADVAARKQTVLPAAASGDTDVDAAAALRAKLGLATDAPLRIAYVPGPGDAVGTFGHWRNGEHDPRVPVFTYSSMYYELLEKLDAQGLLVTRNPGTDAASIAKNTPPEARVTFQHHLKGPKDGFAGYWRREVAYGRGLMRYITRFDPHVVVISTDVPWFIWPQLGRNRVCFLSAHNTFWKMGGAPSGLRQGLRLKATRYAMKGLSGAVCTSFECARQIKILSQDTLPTWVEIPQQKRRFANMRSRDAVRDICFIGRIEEAKGMFMLLDAFAAVAKDRPDMTLTFAGSGRTEQALSDRIAAMADPRICFLGRLPAAGIHDMLDRSDLLVCPTRTDFAEGLGLVVAEAAAHGVPSIVSTMVPARDLFGSACAVFAADDTQALIDTLEGLIARPEAFRALCDGTAEKLDMMLDRNLSWGSRLYQAMLGTR